MIENGMMFGEEPFDDIDDDNDPELYINTGKLGICLEKELTVGTLEQWTTLIEERCPFELEETTLQDYIDDTVYECLKRFDGDPGLYATLDNQAGRRNQP